MEDRPLTVDSNLRIVLDIISKYKINRDYCIANIKRVVQTEVLITLVIILNCIEQRPS